MKLDNNNQGRGIQAEEGDLSYSNTPFQHTHSIGKKSEGEISYYNKLNKLSQREKEVIKLLSKPSMTFSKVGKILDISKDEVKTYWKRIRRKLNAK